MIVSLFSTKTHDKTQMPDKETALPGRPGPIETALTHFVSGNALKGPYPSSHEIATFGLGCFWGAERLFWQQEGVFVSFVGYGGGLTPNPTYEEVCTGLTGHNELVRIVFDPQKISYSQLLKLFWENHDPSQGMRQGNDIGTQYRSGIYPDDEAQDKLARQSLDDYQKAMREAGYDTKITTEIAPLYQFYFAEDYHQQYLAKNPDGYCGIGGLGIACPMPTGTVLTD